MLPAEPTCAEIGVILRGEVSVDDTKAGPAREQTIQMACERDGWARDVIRCAASEPHPTACLGQLSDEQRKNYESRLRGWADKFDPAPLVTDDSGLSCAEALHNADFMRPLLDDTSPERAWQSEQRRRYLISECEQHGWNDIARACLAIATTPDAIDACLTSELDPAALDVIHKRLEATARDAKAIATLRKTPAKIDCKHVADKAACKSEQWDDFRRACLIVGRSDCAPPTSGQP